MVKYYGEYDDLNNNRIKVDILVDGYSGEPIELLMSRPAITINYNTENIFAPLKKSGAEISFLVENVIEELFTGRLTSPKVRIYRNNELFWFGYITPNIYTQPYKDEVDILTLECVDSLSQLNLKKFKKTQDISSFLSIILSIIEDMNIDANKIYYPRTIAVSGNNDVLDNLYIQERNFLDEKEEPENCDMVIGEILKYLGFQMMQYKDAYYIFDYDAIENGNYNAWEYTISSGTKSQTTLTFTPKEITPSLIGVGRGTVTLDGVYNKVTVIANTNPLGDLLPEFDDDEDLINQNVDPDKRYEETYTFDNVSHTLISGFFKSKANWNYTQPKTGGGLSPLVPIDEVTLSNRDSLTEGIFWQKVDSYRNDEPEPSSLNLTTYLTMLGGGVTNLLPELELANTKPIILNGGYLILNMTYKFSTDARAHNVVKSMYDSPQTFGTCTDLKWTDDEDYIGTGNWPNDTTFLCKISVGDYQYNGEDWELISEYNARHARYQATYTAWGIDNAGTTNHWYRYKNTYGDWEYITETMYNQSSSPTKQSGDCEYAHANYAYRTDNNQKVYITKDFYNEYFYGDSFYLVHKNTTAETIYDKDYQLTNTVSYRMNINDASDGVAIKCPDDKTIFGNLNFRIIACNKLGVNPQYRTDNPTTTLKAIHLSDLWMKYSRSDSYSSIYSDERADPDTTYTNVINSGYCQELEDIELRVNTDTKKAMSYSFVMGKKNDEYYYIDGLNYVGEGKKLPEEKLIERLTTHYGQPKYQYANTLKNDSISPFTFLTENNLNKTMIVTNVEYDMTDNNAAVDTIEL